MVPLFSCLLVLVATATLVTTVRRETAPVSPEGVWRSARRVVFPGEEQSPRTHRAYQSQSECDATMRDQEGWIFSPNYPSDYENYRVCNYVIERLTSDTCRVEMVINDFDIEESDNCDRDHLDLRDGQQGLLCGSLASGTKKILEFPAGRRTMTLRFHTDGQNTRKGFMVQLKQLPRSCGGTGVPRASFCNQYIDTFTSSVTSPGFPNGYGSNLRCAYTVRRADPRICKVLLEFRTLDLGRGPVGSCRGDYLEFPDLTKVCEAYPSRKIVDFPRGSDLLTFTFISDGYGSGQGFDIEVLQVPDSCGTQQTASPSGDGEQCDQEVATPTGRFTSPRYPNYYGPNERCRYTIRKADPSVCSVELHFRRFDLEHSGASCSKDYLALPNLNRLCGSFSGKQTVDLPQDSDYVNLYFVSDPYTHGRGFDIHVTQLFNTCTGYGQRGYCDQEVSTYSGRFTSPSYPTTYPHNQRCTFTIRRVDPTVCSVELDFRKFDVEYSRDFCSRDFLELPDKNRLCGSLTGIRVIKFSPGSDILTLNFYSDNYNAGLGFDITVTQRRNTCGSPSNEIESMSSSCFRECNVEISTSIGRITSPGYPRYYAPGLRCQYLIRRPDSSTCSVELDFRTFDVEASAGCSKDYLELPDRSKLCGGQTTTKVLDYSSVIGNSIILNFVSDTIGAGRGFDIVVRQLPNSCSVIPPAGPCDQTVTEEVVLLHSPGYPADYPPNSRCVYTVHKLASSTCQVQLEFLDFDLEPSTDCINDFLELEGNGEKFCGARLPPNKVLGFAPGSNVMRIIFASDGLTSRRGFEMRLSQLRNSCYRPVGPDSRTCGTFNEVNSYIQSENFPLLYNANTDCVYKILRFNKDICQLELYFSHFDVATDNSATCDRDYLEVKGARYCGKRDGQRVLVDFPSNQNEITIRFKTDSYEQLSGFRIEAKQLTSGCSPTPSETCDRTYSQQTFQIISPGYQTGLYPDNQDCRFTVKKSSFDVCALEVKYYTFDLEQSDDCAKDFLQIAEQKLCGRLEYDSVRTYEFLEDETEIKFHSDSYKSGAGFFLYIQQVAC